MDTPYDAGCYVFDIYVPNDYPKSFPTIIHANNCGKNHNPKFVVSGGAVLIDKETKDKILGKDKPILAILHHIQCDILCLSPYDLLESEVVQSTVPTSYSSYYNGLFNDNIEANYHNQLYRFDPLKGLKPEELSDLYNRYIRYYNIVCLKLMIGDKEGYPFLYPILMMHLLILRPYLEVLYKGWEHDHRYASKGPDQHEVLQPMGFRECMKELFDKIDLLI
jgi:hypothetical protein